MSQQINSTFEITNWPFLKYAYNNIIRDQNINENATLKIIGNHLNGYSNKDVNAISFIGCKFSKFPQQLTAVFPNIEAIYIYQSNMPYILREDLKEYKKIKQFYIEENKITFLQQDLLADMKSLEIFYVHENNLLYVEPEIFDNLGNIRYINFDQCSIHNFTFNADGSKDCKTLEEVKKKLQEKHQN
ncbi:hypothetical protein PVAND_000875 [Polypedilum vanderplanki]|uniref:Leucine rich repeat protein n=1 Tax=Polypedilum vanderplanki TaxID=319348 RepID=A0A9J6BME8_POLVA|nr:hypothetical protein PVAND_000875 [Polypedilum vanderplanki]